MNHFQLDINKELNLRLDWEYFKNFETSYDNRFKVQEKNSFECKEELNILRKNVEDKNHSYDLSIAQHEIDIHNRMSKTEAKKMWVYLERFPHYEDLKALNNKFLPEL